jgi:hypothetical protein
LRHMSLRRQHVGIEDGRPQDHHLPGPRAELLDLILRDCGRHARLALRFPGRAPRRLLGVAPL